MKIERLIWWGAMALCAAIYAASYLAGLSVYVLPFLVGAALLFLFERGERGAFPFRKRHVVEYQANYFGFVVLLAVIFNLTPRILPSGAAAVQPLVWAVPMIALYLIGLYMRRTA